MTCLVTSTLLSAPHPLKHLVYLVCQMFLRHIKRYNNVQKYYRAVTKDFLRKTGGNSLTNATALQVLFIRDTLYQC